MASDIKVSIKIDPESYHKTMEELDKLNNHAYLLTVLFKRSWLLRLIFGINLKKLDIEVKYV